MAYDPEEDIFLLEEENLEYVFSNLPADLGGRRIILSMVAHEIRHRVQYLIPETVLWTEEDSLLRKRKHNQGLGSHLQSNPQTSGSLRTLIFRSIRLAKW